MFRPLAGLVVVALVATAGPVTAQMSCVQPSSVATTAFRPVSAVPGSSPGGLPEAVSIGSVLSSQVQRHVHLDGLSGRLDWAWTSRAGTIAASGFDALRAGGRSRVLLSIDRLGSDCVPLAVTTIDSKTGAAAVHPALGPVLRPDEDTLNIVSASHGRFAHDVDASVVEVRAYLDQRQPRTGTLYTADYRDVTPGIAMRGVVLVVTAAGKRVLRVDQPSRVGPGPIAGWTADGSKDGLVTLTTSAGPDEEPVAEVRRFNGSRLVWRTTVRTLPAAWSFLDTATGPAFVTTSGRAGIELGVPERYRVTVLDRRTGRVAWTKDLDGGAGGIVFRSLAGDVLVDDLGHQTATRLSAATGAAVWTTQYVTAINAQHRLVGDHTGSAVPELLLPDAVGGPCLLSGRDGSSTARPALLPASGGSITDVGDLNGDRVHDLAAVAGAGVAIGLSGTNPTGMLLAVDGRTGDLMWQAPFPAANVDTQLASVRVSLSRRHVVVLQSDTAVTAFDGESGTQVWRVALD